jgi:hypothetical protein
MSDFEATKANFEEKIKFNGKWTDNVCKQDTIKKFDIAEKMGKISDEELRQLLLLPEETFE